MNAPDTFTALALLDGPEAEDLDALDFDEDALLDDLEDDLLDAEDDDLARIGLDAQGLYPRPGVRRKGSTGRVVA